MKYEWEQEHGERFRGCIEDASENLPDGFVVVGLIVASEGLGEGAVVLDTIHHDLWAADVLSDASHDMTRLYRKFLDKVFK